MSQAFHHLTAQYAAEGGAARLFSQKVADYVASRPDYPAGLCDALDSLVQCARSPVRVADLGAGTGLLTQALLARGHEVVAIEPSAPMRAVADQYLSSYPRYSSLEGTAEAIPLGDQSVDLVTAATAFHWFDVPRAMAECLRVLRPDGLVALIWNDRVFSDPFHQAFDEIAAEFGGEKLAALADHQRHDSVTAFFGKATPKILSWPHEHSLDEEGLASLFFSRSYIPARQTAEGQRLSEAVRDLFGRHSQQGQVRVRYTTVAYVGLPR